MNKEVTLNQDNIMSFLKEASKALKKSNKVIECPKCNKEVIGLAYTHYGAMCLDCLSKEILDK